MKATGSGRRRQRRPVRRGRDTRGSAGGRSLENLSDGITLKNERLIVRSRQKIRIAAGADRRQVRQLVGWTDRRQAPAARRLLRLGLLMVHSPAPGSCRDDMADLEACHYDMSSHDDMSGCASIDQQVMGLWV